MPKMEEKQKLAHTEGDAKQRLAHATESQGEQKLAQVIEKKSVLMS